MRSMVSWCFVVLCLGGLPAFADEISFDLQIRRILSDKCFQCHGPDDAAREAELRLDEKESLFAKRDSGAIVVPGKPEASLLIQRVNHTDPEQRMPPPSSSQQLSSEDLKLLKAWIEQGASWSQHWSFVAPRRPELPKLKRSDWHNNAIDAFVLAELEKRGRAPSPIADRATLLRRVTLDLTGLPPTVEALDRFLNDTKPGAYERKVDRLLASPQHGEHAARFWLDVARYADTNGYQYDTTRTQWPWRDWVIGAYNRGMPFDQFTIEQLAGDLLPQPTNAQLVATGFNRNHGITIEGGVIDEEYRTEYVVDRVVTTSTTWLGLTFLCARCHDHKYDPISQKEFYQLFAFFNQVPERGHNGFEPRIKVLDPQRAELEKRLARAKADWTSLLKSQTGELATWERKLREKKGEAISAWTIRQPTDFRASSGATLKIQPDASLLAGGRLPGKEDYEVVFQLPPGRVQSIRLEALKDPSLPHGGAGRAANSNFVLSEFEVAVSENDQPYRKAALARAVADYSQKNYNIAAAIDGTLSGGWAVDGPSKKENRTAVFQLKSPLTTKPTTRIKIRLRHHFGTAHAIGRFRISFSPRVENSFADEFATILATPAKQRTDAQRAKLFQRFVEDAGSPKQQQILLEKRQVERELQNATRRSVSTMIMRDMDKPRPTHALYRGQYNQKKEPVNPGVPKVFPAMGKKVPRNRLGFARWLTNENHPLMARVAANRVWQRFFGRGLVGSLEDFGSQGDRPTHPQLLDWLAIEFRESGWDTKKLQRLIVLSSTYRQSSQRKSTDVDPANVYLGRGPRQRLDSEVIRDSILHASGLLDLSIGGPSVFPYHPEGLWLEINNRPGYSQKYQQGKGVDLYRRSLYTFWKRTVPPPSMQTFDAPEREFCVVQRSVTNTPLQAFVLLHDPQFVEAATFLARRMLNELDDKADDRQRIRYGFRLLTSREPSDREVAVVGGYLQDRRKKLGEDPAAARRLVGVGESNADASEDASTIELAAWASVARLLLNLSEVITKS